MLFTANLMFYFRFLCVIVLTDGRVTEFIEFLWDINVLIFWIR